MAEISIIMSTYCRNRPSGNCPNLLRRAIDSILAQTFTNWELILIDDGSKDGSEGVCREYAQTDERIQYVRFEDNSGCPAKRYNDGMKLAQSPYFMFMFDDDYLYPHAMKCLHDAKTFGFPECGMVYGLSDYVDAKTGDKKLGFGEPWNMQVLSDHNILGNLSVVVSRAAINAVGGYDENPVFRRWCDWDLWRRIGMRFPVGRLPVTVGCVMHSSPDSLYRTVQLSATDEREIRKIWAQQNRSVRLQGEIAVASASKKGDSSIKPSVDLIGKKVCVVMGYKSQEERFVEMSKFAVSVNMEYCQKHGYGFRLYSDGFAADRHPAWSKLLFVQDVLKDYQWVMWIDSDAIVSNSEKTLDGFLDDNFMMVFGRQNCPAKWNSVNSGVFFSRNHPSLKEFCDRVWADVIRPDKDRCWEQSSIRYVMDTPPFKNLFKIVNRREFNSLVYHESIGGKREDYGDNEELWHPGDFVAHFGGKRPDVLAAMKNILIDRKVLETKSIVFVTQNQDARQKRWTVGYLSESLKRLGIASQVVDYSNPACERICEGADVVIVFKCFSSEMTVMMRRLRAKGKFLGFYLDDYLIQPGCKYTGVGGFSLEPLRLSHILMSPNANLLSKMPLDKPKILRRNVLDKEGMDALKQQYRRNPLVFSVGMTMAPGRGNEMDGFIAEMLKELDRRVEPNEKVMFHYFDTKLFGSFSRIEVKRHNPFAYEDWKGFYSKIVSLDLGVVVNPLDEKNEYWAMKSELKLVECGAMGVPLIISRVTPYTECVTESVTGFFASTPKETVDKILLVMRNIPLSRQVSEKISEYVRKNYDIENNAEKFLRDLAQAKMQLRDEQYAAGLSKQVAAVSAAEIIAPIPVEQRARKDMDERTRILQRQAAENAAVAKIAIEKWKAIATASARGGK